MLIDINLEIEVLEDAIKQSQRCLHVDPNRQQRTNGEKDARLDRCEGDERTDTDRAKPISNRPATGPINQRRQNRKRGADRCHHPTARHALAHLKLGELARLLTETPRKLGTATHRLAQQDTRDAQRLLHERRNISQRLLTLGRQLAALHSDAARQQDEERHEDDRENRQAPIEQKHRDDRRQHRRDV